MLHGAFSVLTVATKALALCLQRCVGFRLSLFSLWMSLPRDGFRFPTLPALWGIGLLSVPVWLWPEPVRPQAAVRRIILLMTSHRGRSGHTPMRTRSLMG